jgi:hypothetical protein
LITGNPFHDSDFKSNSSILEKAFCSVPRFSKKYGYSPVSSVTVVSDPITAVEWRLRTGVSYGLVVEARYEDDRRIVETAETATIEAKNGGISGSRNTEGVGRDGGNLRKPEQWNHLENGVNGEPWRTITY